MRELFIPRAWNYARAIVLLVATFLLMTASTHGQTPTVGTCAATPTLATVPTNTPFRACVILNAAAPGETAGVDAVTVTIVRGTTPIFTGTKPIGQAVNGEMFFDVPAQTTAATTYAVTACNRKFDPADATNFSESCIAAVAFAVAKPVVPKPPVPGVKIIGMATIAGLRGARRVEIDVTSIELLQLAAALSPPAEENPAVPLQAIR